MITALQPIQDANASCSRTGPRGGHPASRCRRSSQGRLRTMVEVRERLGLLPLRSFKRPRRLLVILPTCTVNPRCLVLPTGPVTADCSATSPRSPALLAAAISVPRRIASSISLPEAVSAPGRSCRLGRPALATHRIRPHRCSVATRSLSASTSSSPMACSLPKSSQCARRVAEADFAAAQPTSGRCCCVPSTASHRRIPTLEPLRRSWPLFQSAARLAR